MSSIDVSERVRLGSAGWSNPLWRESFYPADMPEEWQLTYFNTQFNCAFLDRTFWQQASSAQMAQWIADTHEEFRFLLEGDEQLTVPTELADKALLLRREDPCLCWFSRDSSLKELAAALSGKSGAAPRFLLSQDGDLGMIDRVGTLLEVMGL